MAWWERQYIFTDTNPFYESLFWYGHYIDDLILIWWSDMAAIPELIFYFNNNNFGLFFTFYWDTRVVSFLDLTLTCDTTTYRKDTAGNTTLHAVSCHPIHNIKAVLICELTRTRCNCSTEETFNLEKNIVCERLKKRRYQRWMLKQAVDRISNINRDSLLSNVSRKKKHTSSNRSSQPLVFSTPYSLPYNKVRKYHTKIYTCIAFRS